MCQADVREDMQKTAALRPAVFFIQDLRQGGYSLLSPQGQWRVNSQKVLARYLQLSGNGTRKT